MYICCCPLAIQNVYITITCIYRRKEHTAVIYKLDLDNAKVNKYAKYPGRRLSK